MVEVHNSSVEEDKEGRHIFTPRARRIMKSRFGGFSALVAGIVILIPSLFNGGPYHQRRKYRCCNYIFNNKPGAYKPRKNNVF